MSPEAICKEPGLYVVFEDGNHIVFSVRSVEDATRRYLLDPALLPESVKRASSYAPCEICPERYSATICHALMPAFPYMESVRKGRSIDRVTAVFRQADGHVHIRETTMQQALKYVTLMSLVQYCEIGRRFGPFFAGTHPLMEPDELAVRICENLFVEFEGDQPRIARKIREIQDLMSTTIACQVRRLKLLPGNESLINAYVATQGAVDWISVAFEDRTKGYAAGN